MTGMRELRRNILEHLEVILAYVNKHPEVTTKDAFTALQQWAIKVVLAKNVREIRAKVTTKRALKELQKLRESSIQICKEFEPIERRQAVWDAFFEPLYDLEAIVDYAIESATSH